MRRGPGREHVVLCRLPFPAGENFLNLIENDQGAWFNVHPEFRHLGFFEVMQLLLDGEIRQAAGGLDHLLTGRIHNPINVRVDHPAPLKIIEDLLNRLVGLAGARCTSETNDHRLHPGQAGRNDVQRQPDKIGRAEDGEALRQAGSIDQPDKLCRQG